MAPIVCTKESVSRIKFVKNVILRVDGNDRVHHNKILWSSFMWNTIKRLSMCLYKLELIDERFKEITLVTFWIDNGKKE